MKKFNIGILMLFCCVCSVQNVYAQVIRVYTSNGEAREISDVDKVVFQDSDESGMSIYHELQSRRSYTTQIQLIDDLGYTELLSNRGNYTFFAVNDKAFQDFFKSNPWGVTSYSTLTRDQKRKLLKVSILPDACLLKDLSCIDIETEQLCLRRPTLITDADFVSPMSVQDFPKGNGSWEDLFDTGKDIYIGGANIEPMLIQFHESVLKKNYISKKDVETITGRSWNAEGVRTLGFIQDSRIVNGDIICSNGCLHFLDKVIFPFDNMAEVIHQNEATQYFSLLLNRFSLPCANQELAQQYNELTGSNVEMVYEKRYRELIEAFYNSTQEDMSAIFVPCDDAVEKFFLQGGGAMIIAQNCDLPNTLANLKQNLNQLPEMTLSRLLCSLMDFSFCNTVPSRFGEIYDDNMNPLFPNYQNENSKLVLEQCIMANNGIVYVTKVWPYFSELSSILSPILFSDKTKVMKAVVTADDRYIEGASYNQAPLKQYFSTYLNAMQSNFSFFVPIDEGLENYGYVEAASFATQPYGTKSTNRYYWSFKYDDVTRGAVIPVEATAYIYKMAEGQQPGEDKMKGNSYISKVTDAMWAGVGQQKRLNLIEMVNQHILVHDDAAGVNDERTYYLSRSGAPLRLTEKGTFENKNVGMKVEGGYQVMINDPAEGYTANDHNAVVLEGYDKTAASNGYGNGMTYLIDRPVQPTMRSVYNHFKVPADNNPYSDFYELANPEYVSSDLLDACGYFDLEEIDSTTGKPKKMSAADQQAEKLKFHVFVRQNDNIQGTNTYCPANREQLVRFFNNYNYTVYVPTNDQVAAARAMGLMTWKEIYEWVKIRTNDFEDELTKEDRAKARTMITVLVNFVKYHFQDQSVFVDNVTAAGYYQSSCFNSKTYAWLPLYVTQTPFALTVKDRSGNTVSVVASEERRNVLAREICYNAAAASASYIKNSSYVVIHQIDGYLNYNSDADYEGLYYEGDETKNLMPKGRFDFWNYSTPKQMNAYVSKFRFLN